MRGDGGTVTGGAVPKKKSREEEEAQVKRWAVQAVLWDRVFFNLDAQMTAFARLALNPRPSHCPDE